MTPSCQTCIYCYQTHQLVRMCQFFGCQCTDKTASDCPEYDREAGSDDMPWFKGGWCVTSSMEGRGD